MAIIFSAITPHSPLLLPTVVKEKSEHVEATLKAMQRLEEELYVSKPQLIVIISPHASLFPDAFSLNAHTHVQTNFSQFGDLVTKKEWKGAPEVAAIISHKSKSAGIPVQLVSQEQLDHGATIPLFLLTSHLPDVHVLTVGYSNLSPEDHIKFGALLKDGIMDTNKRVAVIASGDLTHSANPIPKNDTKKFSFDEKVITALRDRNVEALVKLSKESEEAKDCGYRSILIALGMIEHMDYSFDTYSYEAPFGVAYLSGNFHV